MMHMLKERWQHFSQRERIIVAAGGAMVVAALVFLLIVDPLMGSIDKLDRQAKRKAKDSQELALVAQEYVVKQARITKIEQRMPSPPAQFSLLAFMEEATTGAQIRDRIVGLQPQASRRRPGLSGNRGRPSARRRVASSTPCAAGGDRTGAL